jgi:hypothetical protein
MYRAGLNLVYDARARAIPYGIAATEYLVVAGSALRGRGASDVPVGSVDRGTTHGVAFV